MKRKLGIAAVLCLFGISIAACSWSVAGGLMGLILTALVGAGLVMGVGVTQAGCNSDDAADTTVGPCLSYIPDVTDSKVEPCLGAPLPDVIEADVGPCLSQTPPDVDEADVGPCLQPPLPEDVDEADVGPCLQPPLPEDVDEADVGPCLQPPLPEDVNEADVGPCLSQTPPDADEADVGPCLSQIPPDADESDDADTNDGGSTQIKDVDLQPCLSPPQPSFDAGGDQASATSPAVEPTASREQVRARLVAEGVLPPDVAERLSSKDKS